MPTTGMEKEAGEMDRLMAVLVATSVHVPDLLFLALIDKRWAVALGERTRGRHRFGADRVDHDVRSC